MATSGVSLGLALGLAAYVPPPALSPHALAPRHAVLRHAVLRMRLYRGLYLRAYAGELVNVLVQARKHLLKAL